MMWGGHGHIKQPLKIRRLKATTTSFTVNIKKHKTLLPRGLTVFVTRSDFFLAPQDASSGGRGGGAEDSQPQSAIHFLFA